ncbi:uncharacterized protein LOC141729013 [Zonotrichia albicollis]|uniref:uncharacterized protein LOC141729013 n=1 Tax=Zonotrichia albicollis TaxID=44394 RepID=UPI003D80FE24
MRESNTVITPPGHAAFPRYPGPEAAETSPRHRVTGVTAPRRNTWHSVRRHTWEEKPSGKQKLVSHALTSAPDRSHSPARSLAPLSPRSLRPTQPKGRPKNQQRKSRAKKIKGIRRALLPLTYILPSARGGPAADGSCSAGGDTGLTARPACRRGRAAARHPETRCGPVPAAAVPSRPPPQRDQPLPGAGGGGKFLRGGARRAPLPLRRNHRLREGRKKGKREVATQARSMLTFQYSFNSTVQSTITARKATCVPTNSQRFISLDFPSIERPLNSY